MTLDEIQNAQGKSGRDALRAFITANPHWDSMRKLYGYDLGAFTMETYKHVASDLYKIDNLLLAMNDHIPLAKPVGDKTWQVIAQRLLDTINPSVSEASFLSNMTKLETNPSDAQWRWLKKLEARAVQDEQVKDGREDFGKVIEPETPKPHDTGNGIAKVSGDLATAIETVLRGVQGKVSPEQVKEICREIVKEELAEKNVITLNIQRDGQFERVIEGLFHPLQPTLLRMVSVRKADGFPVPVWLVGPAGSGKTTAGRKLAEALALQFYHQGSMLYPHDLLGFVDAGGTYHEPVFVRCYRNGGVILLDECDSSDNSALLALKGCMTNGHISLPNGEIIPRHKDCYILAAANTYGLGATADYIGRAKIDAAFLDEYATLAWGYDEKFEREISGNIDWAITVQRARQRARDKALKVVISPRATINGAVLLAAGISESEVKRMTYLKGLTEDQVKLVEGE